MGDGKGKKLQRLLEQEDEPLEEGERRIRL